MVRLEAYELMLLLLMDLVVQHMLSILSLVMHRLRKQGSIKFYKTYRQR